MKRELQFCIFLCVVTVFEAALAVHPERSLDDKSRFQNDTDYLSYRLPKEIVPKKYVISIVANEENFMYSANVSIHLEILKTTNTIVLHNDGLNINSVGVFQTVEVEAGIRKSIECPIKSTSYDTEKQFYTVNMSTGLRPGYYTVNLSFKAEIRDDVFGFYRSSYNENGQTKWMFVTQFSPTYARRAFPCMDEPGFKAVFDVTIAVTNKTVTSNTEIKTITELFPPERIYQFTSTPTMATYQLGWAVHNFVSQTTTNSSEIFKIWTRKSMNRRGSIALNQGQLIYSFLKDWLVIDNPIRKMDQIAVPDFNFHAMENWGMITYRESVVLYEDGVTPTKNKIDGFTTMAHEYAHTWFGNLVTPMFWDVAWLKEGFASYFQYFAVSEVHPSWRMMDKFVVDMLQPTLFLDSADHARVMNGRNVGSPSSIAAVLDFVSYKKGASVIRMLSHAIGKTAFQDGLRCYVKNMSYQAATPFDLYKHLQASVDKLGHLQNNTSIQDIMKSWTNQPGYPLVTVTRDYESQTLTVSQERFRRNHNQSSSEWWIPLNFVKKSLTDFSNTTPIHWLKPEDENYTIHGVPSNDWVIFNTQQTGYYRVNYDEKNWRMLVDYLNTAQFEKIHRSNRAALLDDAFNLARAGYVDYSVPLDLARYLVQELDYEPWVAAVNSLKFLNKMLDSKPRVQQAFQVSNASQSKQNIFKTLKGLLVHTGCTRNRETTGKKTIPQVKEYAVRLLRGMYEQLNFTESTHDDITTKLHRELVLSTSCLVRNADCLRKSETLFRNWIAAPDRQYEKLIIPDLKSFVYCEGIRNGSEADWYAMLDRWLIADLQTEQDLLLQGLGCTQRANLINRYLELSISDDRNVRKQQRMIIVNAVLDGNARNVEHVVRFVESNFQRIVQLRGYNFLDKVITAIGNATITAEQSETLRSFVQRHSEELGSALNTAKQALSVSSENLEWLEKYSSRIDNYFH